MNEPAREDLNHLIRSLQTLSCKLIQVKEKMQEHDEKIVMSLQHLQTLLDTIPDDEGILSDSPAFAGEIEFLQQTLLSYYHQYSSFLSVFLQCRKEIVCDIKSGISDTNISLSISRIPLFLIHENIYRLVDLIGYYTRPEYFTVHPYFCLSDALEKITLNTKGLILISTGCIPDQDMVIRSIRSRTQIMPVIVMARDENDTQYHSNGYNGVVCEECSIDNLISLFLKGLEVQASVCEGSAERTG